jgi:hypothetical protein
MVTKMQRRQFLLFAGSLAAMGAVTAATEVMKSKSAPVLSDAHTAKAPAFLYSASDDSGGQHFLSRVHLNGSDKTSHRIAFRAHDVLALANDQVLAFGRRPETLCAVIGMRSGEQQLIEAAADRHFYGHGCLSADGAVLFTTENDFEAARGVIGIRDARSLAQIGEYETYGVGPHDIHLMPDGKTLVIANGGIETHPDFGRRKLNLKTMQPSLVYVDVASGKKLDEYRLDDHQLSIRHLSITEKGDVGVAMQYQGDIYRKQPQTLVAWQQAGGELKALPVAGEDISHFQGYMADLAYAAASGLLAVTSPRGNRVAFWDVQTQRFVSAVKLPEPSGIQYLAEQQVFLVSGAKGALYQLDAMAPEQQVVVLHKAEDTLWDNHMVLG